MSYLYCVQVEFALKLGYPESLTQRVLLKLGMAAQQNELLDELIRLQQIKCVDPKVTIYLSIYLSLSISISVYRSVVLSISPLSTSWRTRTNCRTGPLAYVR